MAEEGGDRFDRHAPVDGLGGQGVAEFVGVDVADPGATCDGFDPAIDGMTVEWPLGSGQESAGGEWPVAGLVVGDEFDEVWV